MCTNRRNPLHCILPPYMSDKLDEVFGDNAESETGESFREKRKVKAEEIPAITRAIRLEPVNTKLIREVCDAKETSADPGDTIWKEGDKTTGLSKDAKNVIAGAGHVWNFYKKLFNRNSIDNMGMAIKQTICYRERRNRPFFNAFWDSEKLRMYYGSGSPRFTNSFTTDLDIIGHELSHAVIDYEAAMRYQNQSGALNESFADVFGILIKQWANKTGARKSDWLIGKNILIRKNALRSMKSPGKAYRNDPVFGDDPQPAVMKDYMKMPNTEEDDYGGVHYNSGITNHAFYITSFELNGSAWTKAGAIWYAALLDKELLKKTANFQDAANATLRKAVLLFGKGSLAEKAVKKGWKETGVI
jgi:Zn-dependent metalloprotease